VSAVRAAIGAVLAVGVVAGMVAVSRLPYTAAPGDAGQLRLAWRWRSERLDVCRRLTSTELAKVPVHMRRVEACERRLRPWRLEVSVNGAPVLRDSVWATGAESDRPLSVFRNIPLAPGRYTARVRFSPLGSPADTSHGAGAGTVLRALVLDTTVTVAPRQVVLVTMDDERGVLVVKTRE